MPPLCFQRHWRSISWVGAPFWAMRRAMPTRPRFRDQEPLPRMDARWAGVTAWSRSPELKRVVSSVGDQHISRSQQCSLAALEPVRPAEAALKPVAGKNTAAKDVASTASDPGTPTPTQLAR